MTPLPLLRGFDPARIFRCASISAWHSGGKTAKETTVKETTVKETTVKETTVKLPLLGGRQTPVASDGEAD